MKEAGKLYAAYGCNMNRKQLRKFCPDAILLGQGEIEEYQLEFRQGLATITPAEGMVVPIVLWALMDEDEGQLDLHVGVEQGLYRKETISFKLTKRIDELTNRLVDVSREHLEFSSLVYILNSKLSLKIPDQGYVELIRQGYRENGIETSPLAIALIHTGNNMMET
jgi:hypothetical protein